MIARGSKHQVDVSLRGVPSLSPHVVAAMTEFDSHGLPLPLSIRIEADRTIARATAELRRRYLDRMANKYRKNSRFTTRFDQAEEYHDADA